MTSFPEGHVVSRMFCMKAPVFPVFRVFRVQPCGTLHGMTLIQHSSVTSSWRGGVTLVASQL